MNSAARLDGEIVKINLEGFPRFTLLIKTMGKNAPHFRWLNNAHYFASNFD